MDCYFPEDWFSWWINWLCFFSGCTQSLSFRCSMPASTSGSSGGKSFSFLCRWPFNHGFSRGFQLSILSLNLVLTRSGRWIYNIEWLFLNFEMPTVNQTSSAPAKKINKCFATFFSVNIIFLWSIFHFFSFIYIF